MPGVDRSTACLSRKGLRVRTGFACFLPSMHLCAVTSEDTGLSYKHSYQHQYSNSSSHRSFAYQLSHATSPTPTASQRTYFSVVRTSACLLLQGIARCQFLLTHCRTVYEHVKATSQYQSNGFRFSH